MRSACVSHRFKPNIQDTDRKASFHLGTSLKQANFFLVVALVQQLFSLWYLSCVANGDDGGVPVGRRVLPIREAAYGTGTL